MKMMNILTCWRTRDDEDVTESVNASPKISGQIMMNSNYVNDRKII